MDYCRSHALCLGTYTGQEIDFNWIENCMERDVYINLRPTFLKLDFIGA